MDMLLPDMATLALFVTASLALYISPGPDMLYIASRSIAQGRAAGVASAFGVFAGLLVHMLAAALGLAAVLVVWPFAYLVVKWLGVLYLAYLGLKVLLDRNGGIALPGGNGGAGPDYRRLFRQGLFVNLLNPKIALFFMAFLPQFVDAEKGSIPLQMLFFGSLFNAGGLLWVLFLAVLFGAIGDRIASRPGIWGWQRWITGSVLLALAANLAFAERE